MKHNFWDTLGKWLAPGMNVKRWIILTLFGISLLGMSTMVLVDSTYLGIIKRWAIDVMIDVFGKNRLYTPDWISYLLGFSVLVLGVGSFVYGIKKLLDSIIKSLLPEREKEIADIVREYRFRNKLLNIVVIGGGTGIFPFLQALRDLPFSVTAIVTVADSGGSSGRLRNEYAIPAPGDIRRALIALSPRKASELENLFNYRYKEGSLKDHTVGNLMIAGLTEMSGDFSEAIYQLSKILAIKGKVIPFTLNNLTLCAEFEDGTTVMGEAEIHKCHKRIRRIFFDPPYCKPLLRVIEEIDKADIIMMGPGSLYTSVMPCLIITPIADIIARSEALKIYNANLMTELGETDGYSVTEHLQALFENVNAKVADYVLINQGKIDPDVSGTYAKYNAIPVPYQIDSIRKLGVTPLLADLVDIQEGLIRHSPEKVALAIVDLVNKTHLIRGKKFKL
jgi:uncharacterized cofD-like protein